MSNDLLNWEYAPDVSKQRGPNNAAVRSFAEKGLYTSLTREVIQNSLDAHLDDSTVNLTFNVIEIEPEKIPNIEGLNKMISNCKLDNNEPVNEKVEIAENCLNSPKIKVLKIHESSGTKGMSPADIDRKVPFSGTPFLKSDFSNFFFLEGGNDKSGNDMGSNGIGKNAYFAASLIDTLIVSTKYHDAADNEDKTSIMGQTEFMTALIKDKQQKFKSSTWYLSNQEEEDYHPIPVDKLDKKYSWLEREEDGYGTTFYIIGIADHDWKDEIVIATMSNFFLGIINESLRVKVDDVEINSKNIEQQLEKYNESDLKDIIGDKKLREEYSRIKYFIKCYKSPTHVGHINPSSFGQCEIKLYTDIEESLLAKSLFKHVVLVRRDFVVCRCDQSDAAIKLTHQSFGSNIKRFVAIITPGLGNSENSGQQLIRKLENASHTNLDPQRLKTYEEQKKVGRALEDMAKKTKEWIKERISIDENDGDIDLSYIADILPIELEGKINKDKESKTNPEKQKLKNKNSRKIRKLIPIPGLIDDGDEGYPPRKKKNKKRKSQKKRPPWSGGNEIPINSFKFLREGESIINLNFLSNQKVPVALYLESPGLASKDPINILECMDSSATIETHEDKTWILFEITKNEVNLRLKIEDNVDLSNIAIVPTVFKQRKE